MKSRCLNKTHTGYEYYGGRSVTISARWLEPAPQGFLNFLADMGLRPRDKTLDRKNPFGNYEPDNCQWATAKWQANNKRANYTPEEIVTNFEQGVPSLQNPELETAAF
ncbi:MAG TPA: hypothetical protein VJW94_14600 [Candidatus Acidoferrum sp.]|nr:hypothetical protein [Candidatus Acidoferrum sp.]